MNFAHDAQPLVVICGPTAAGKTRCAIELARQYPCEIVSADSRQVYRWMDIGTAKATIEEQLAATHHLLDVVDPDEDFSVADYVNSARAAIGRIHARGRLPVVVGGTGLYITALLHGLIATPPQDEVFRNRMQSEELQSGIGTLHNRLQAVDPVLAKRLQPGDQVRIIRALEVFHLTGERMSALQARHSFQENPYRTLFIGVTADRETLYQRIDQRVEFMLSSGLLTETERLLQSGFSPDLKAMRTIGYRECCRYLAGEISLETAKHDIQRETRRYAKRQLTWFRRNNLIIWVDSVTDSANIIKIIDHFYMY